MFDIVTLFYRTVLLNNILYNFLFSPLLELMWFHRCSLSLMTHNHLLLKSRHRPVYPNFNEKRGEFIPKEQAFWVIFLSSQTMVWISLHKSLWNKEADHVQLVKESLWWGVCLGEKVAKADPLIASCMRPAWAWVTVGHRVGHCDGGCWLWHNSLVVVCGNRHCPAPAHCAQAPSLVHCIRHN